MATVFRKEGSPFFYAAYFDAQGKRRYRTTKRKRRTEAVAAANEMEAASRRTGSDSDARELLSILEEATQRAIRGQLNSLVARTFLERILKTASGEELYDPSIEDWLKGWLEEKRKSRSSGTAARYKVVIDQFLDSLPEEKRRNSLSSMSIEDVRRYRDWLVEGGRTAVTANSAVKILRVPLNVARRQGILAHNPAEGVEMLTQDESKRGVFSPAQIRQLLSEAEGDWRGMILAGYYTGGRISDLANLGWTAIDLSAGIIEFRQAKTKQTVRIPIHEEFKKWLLNVPASNRQGPVFPSLAGSGSSGASGLSWQFRRIMERSRVEGSVTERRGSLGKRRYSLSFHSLRHSFNSAMANAGVPQEVRQRLTGHTSKAINDRYTHAEFSVLQEAVGKVPALAANGSREETGD